MSSCPKYARHIATGRVTFLYISTCLTSCSERCRRPVVSFSRYGTSDSLWCRCLSMFVSFIKSCLFSDFYQTRVGRRYDKVNVSWWGGRYGELLTLENHVDLTSFGWHDFFFGLTIHHVYPLTIWYLYNDADIKQVLKINCFETINA